MQKLYSRNTKINIIETVFNTTYLLTAAVCAAVLFIGGNKINIIIGTAAAILASGDSFHLLPRIAAMWRDKDYSRSLGTGKLIASLTMTVFYLCLIFLHI